MVMMEQPESKQPRALRNLWKGFGAAVAIVLCFVGYTFWSRRTENAELAYKQQAGKTAQQREPGARGGGGIGRERFQDHRVLCFARIDSPGRDGRHVLRSFEREDGEAGSSGGECVAFGEPVHAGDAEEDHDVYVDD